MTHMRPAFFLASLLTISLLAGCESRVNPTTRTPPTPVKVSNPNPKGPPDFWNARWGMTQDEVQAKGRLVEVSPHVLSILNGDCRVQGLSCISGHYFLKGRLAEGVVLITTDYASPNGYVRAYDRLRGKLSTKYGKPSKEDTHWEDDVRQEDPEDWGLAVAMGLMTKQAVWETDRTEILLTLRGGDFNVNLAVSYYSRNLKKALEEDLEAQSNDHGL